MAEADLSKIVNLIMENPKLIEEIKNLASNGPTQAEPTPEVGSDEEVSVNIPEEATTYTPEKPNIGARRKDLLSALKPYVSEKRAQAIDSMMTIAEILDVMKTR